MGNVKIRRAGYAFAVAFLAAIVLVGFRYGLWERTLHVDATGHGVQLSTAASNYITAFDAIYTPQRILMGYPLALLRFGGVAIDLLSDLVGVTLQNFAVLVVGYTLHRAWR